MCTKLCDEKIGRQSSYVALNWEGNMHILGLCHFFFVFFFSLLHLTGPHLKACSLAIARSPLLL
jgi:hypothetical protein